eukprot:NODE_19_length_47148_cov_1.447810.p15 type:complete len:331 gc:universal NODE_19_length_47148_cov_1.447810:45267-44275(-)
MFKILKKLTPMTLGRYMDICLTDPNHGYYTTKQVFGSQGDFVTSPEFTQLIGELLAIGIVYSHSNQPVELVELGPGQGKLMSDMLRTFQKLKFPIARVNLFETSELLKSKQREILKPFNVPLKWSVNLGDIETSNSLIFIAHEYFDAIPMEQFKFIDGIWHICNVASSENSLKYVYNEDFDEIIPKTYKEPVIEISRQRENIFSLVLNKIKKSRGMMYTIDYGKFGQIGNTFRAIKDHKYVEPLAYPGESDLTSDVDFETFTKLATTYGVSSKFGSQTEFLHSLGLKERVIQLLQSSPEKEKQIWQMYDRLISMNAYQILRVYTDQKYKL